VRASPRGITFAGIGSLSGMLGSTAADQPEGEAMNQSTARGLAFLFIGAVVATSFLFQLVMGVLSVIPLAVWLFLVLMAVCILLRCCTGKQGEALREDLTEAQRKARVRTLQKEVSRLKMQLSDPIAQASLSRARQELNSLWKKSDGWIY